MSHQQLQGTQTIDLNPKNLNYRTKSADKRARTKKLYQVIKNSTESKMLI
jgi:hypothetical protein